MSLFRVGRATQDPSLLRGSNHDLHRRGVVACGGECFFHVVEAVVASDEPVYPTSARLVRTLRSGDLGEGVA